MNVFYIGSSGPLSVQPFRWLLQSEYVVCGIGLDRDRADSRSNEERSSVLEIEHNELVMLARQHDVPAIDLCAEPWENTAAKINGLNPDLIVVSCYARKLPNAILGIPRYGAVNCHPSILPAYRGPVPLFWQFRNGEDSLGITLHFMTDQWDAGDIIATARMPVIDGQRNVQVNTALASVLCDLLKGALERFPDAIQPVAQQPECASYQGYPLARDFHVMTSWSARRIFNFMRANEHWGRPYPCETGGRYYDLKHALLFSEDEADELLPNQPDVIQLCCNPGTMVASYYQ